MRLWNRNRGMTIRSRKWIRRILTHTDSVATVDIDLADPEMKTDGMDTRALPDSIARPTLGITISN